MLSVCYYGAKNTGVGCFPEIKSTLMHVLVPLRDKLGALNKIDLTANPTLDQTYFDALVNQADPSKRWYPIPVYKNSTDVRSESLTQSFDDGSSVIIEQGARTFMAIITGKKASPILYKQLKSFQNIPYGVFIIDTSLNLVGQRIDTTKMLYPIPIDQDSFDPIWNPGTATEKQKIAMKMVYSRDVNDANISMIAAEELSYNLSYLAGLLNVTAVYTNPLANSGGSAKFTLELKTEYGTINNPVRVSGLLAADFVLEEMTSGSPVVVVITSVTEQLDSAGDGTGIYDFVFGVQTANDTFRVTPSKNGFDFSEVKAKIVTLL